MEDELFDNDNFEPTETPQEAPFDDDLHDDDWGTHSEPEHPQNEDDPWLTPNPFADQSPSGNTDDADTSETEWTSTSTSSNEGEDAEDVQEQHKNYKGSAISFTGYGRCSCGCGSFGGHGDICTYCGHPYSAHSRYKKK